MKTQFSFLSVAVVALGLAVAPNASADFAVSLRTTSGDASDSGATRLYNDAGLTDASELTDPLWLVIDLDGDGIWAAGSPANFTFDGTLAGLQSSLIDADDYVFKGTLGGAVQGRTLQTISGVPSAAQTGGTPPTDAGGTVKPSFALLFDDSNLLNGGTFGFDALVANGVVPAIGNVNLRIGQNTSADAFSFSVVAAPVPEPATFGLLAGGIAAMVGLRRRNNQAKA